MCKHRAQAHDVRPRNLRVASTTRFGHCSGRFTDDLEQALDGELTNPVDAKGILASGDNRGDLAGRVEDIGDALVVSLIHP
jgi:hypothetical protein